MNGFGLLEPAADQVQILPQCRDALLALLLKGMQYVDRFRKAHGVDGTVVSVWKSSTISSTPAPLNPFIGLASGCLPPFCAARRAKPITRCASDGKERRSSLLEPIQTTDFEFG
jgi:hypothetical protein